MSVKELAGKKMVVGKILEEKISGCNNKTSYRKVFRLVAWTFTFIFSTLSPNGSLQIPYKKEPFILPAAAGWLPANGSYLYLSLGTAFY